MHLIKKKTVSCEQNSLVYFSNQSLENNPKALQTGIIINKTKTASKFFRFSMQSVCVCVCVMPNH